MLSMNNGSIERAKEMAHQMIKSGVKEVWLDLALLQSAQGDLTSSKESTLKYLKYFPDCPRALYGKAYIDLSEGNLKDGLKFADYGRMAKVLGNPFDIKFDKPMWDGKISLKDKTVLLCAEGGIGDQLMELRSIKHLNDMGANVIYACSKEIVPLISKYSTQKLGAVVDFEQPITLYYDYYIMGFSSFGLLNLTWETLWNGVTLKLPQNPIWQRIILPNEFNVGIRYSGNPKFEHEQLRKFPPELMFDAVLNRSISVYSLQKGDNSVVVPSEIMQLEGLLGTWEETAYAINRMDIVISSCTSIAHLAANMGKKTYVIVPVMSYYCWRQKGDKTSWYPSVKIFRQKMYGEWKEPFVELSKELDLLKKHDNPIQQIQQNNQCDLNKHFVIPTIKEIPKSLGMIVESC